MARPTTDAKGRDTGTVRQHYEALVARGRTEYAAMVKGPDLPDGWRWLWETYQEISEGRGSGGMGPARLTWGDLAAWQEVAGVGLSAWESGTLFAMDAALVAAMTTKEA